MAAGAVDDGPLFDTAANGIQGALDFRDHAARDHAFGRQLADLRRGQFGQQAVAFCAQPLDRGQLPLAVVDRRLRRAQFGQQAVAFCAQPPLLGGGSVAVLPQLGQRLVGVVQLGLQACGLVAQGLQLCLLVGARCARAIQFTAQTIALPDQGLLLRLELRKLLAGLLETEEARVRSAYSRAGFRLARRMVNGDWSILWLRKRRI